MRNTRRSCQTRCGEGWVSSAARWRHDDRRRAGRGKLFAVLGIGQKTDLAGAGASKGADLRDDDRTVALSSPPRRATISSSRKPPGTRTPTIAKAYLPSESDLMTLSVMSSLGLTQTTS